MTTETDWPFDADRDDPLARLRIPVVSSPYPVWTYEVALVIGKPDGFGPDGPWGPALRPTDAETRQLVAYLGYRMEYYNKGWKARMRRRPLDVDGSTNTVILQKRGEDNWCFRRASWDGGLMIPTRDQEPQSLETVLAIINDTAKERWRAWKAAHPEAFGPTARHQ